MLARKKKARKKSKTVLWSCPFQTERYVVGFLALPYFIDIPVVYANGVDPDQTPQNAASDLGLHCLPVSILWDAMHKLINVRS